jgi:hypothetical protein
MDEMTMVRHLLDEPPPPPDVVAEGRERLFGSPAGAIRTARPRRAVPRIALALTVTAAVAAIALAVTALLPSGTTRDAASRGGGDRVATQGSARAVLLTAAVHTDSVQTSGRYWHVRSMTTTTLPRRFGHGDNRYVLEQLSITERWTTHAGRTWLGRRQWVRPKTAEDEAAWRRDGSPTTWCTGKTDTEPPKSICLHTAPGAAVVMRFGPDAFDLTEGRKLTFARLQLLPRDPVALRAWLVRIAQHELDPSASAAIVDLNVANELADLLVDFPVPPGVRAAAFRALADMPGVTSIGSVRDSLGRAGVGIQIGTMGMKAIAVLGDGSAVAGPSGELIRTLIVDPDTSRVLADETSIGRHTDPVGDTLILVAGWTNGSPHRPTSP